MINKNRFLAGFVLLVVWAMFLAGQALQSRIIGNVKNEDGTYLAGVAVTVTNINNNAVTTKLTGKKKGVFRFLSLPPGVYQVSIDLEGYEPFVLSGIGLSDGQTANLPIKLKKKPADNL